MDHTTAATQESLAMVNVSGCPMLRDASLATLAECPNLCELRVAGLERLEGEALVRIAKSCQYLRVIDVTRCSRLRASLLQQTVCHTHRLEELIATDCLQFGHGMLLALAGRPLKRLDCGFWGEFADEKELACPDRERSELARAIADSSVLTFFTDSTTRTTLLHVNLDGCVVTPAACMGLSECTHLESLSLSSTSMDVNQLRALLPALSATLRSFRHLHGLLDSDEIVSLCSSTCLEVTVTATL